MDIAWAEEDAEYIASQSKRYPGALDIEVEWTREVLADARLVAIVPYPRSRVGASGFVGWSPGAGRVLLVSPIKISTAIFTASTPGPHQDVTSPPTTNGKTMPKKPDEESIETLREDARRLEQHASSSEPYPEGTATSRPNAPSRMFNLRLSDEQFDALQQIANAKHLPMSTMARAWLLDRLDAEQRVS
ncbi:MAG: hypothetical protein M3500_05120 [Actinomycetota bacterium]|nr:hypothetical protein [Actinomycetota bacterium]